MSHNPPRLNLPLFKYLKDALDPANMAHIVRTIREWGRYVDRRLTLLAHTRPYIVQGDVSTGGTTVGTDALICSSGTLPARDYESQVFLFGHLLVTSATTLADRFDALCTIDGAEAPGRDRYEVEAIASDFTLEPYGARVLPKGDQATFDVRLQRVAGGGTATVIGGTLAFTGVNALVIPIID